MFSTPSLWPESAIDINNNSREIGADIPNPDIRSQQRALSACNNNIRGCDSERPSLSQGHLLHYFADDRCNRDYSPNHSGEYIQGYNDSDYLNKSESFEDNVAEASNTTNFSLTSSQINVTERARLACQACRRDNKKCDNNRPCARCLARGENCIHVEKAARTTKRRCQTCRLNHLKCEDTRPCHQCVRAGSECLDAVTKGGNHRIKVKKACKQCRRSKIQCDEEWPCRNCIRKNHVCGGVDYSEDNFEGMIDKIPGHPAELRTGDFRDRIPSDTLQKPLSMKTHKVDTDHGKKEAEIFHTHNLEAFTEGPTVFTAAQNPVLNFNTFPHNYPIALDSLQQRGFAGINVGVHSYNSDECRRVEPSLHTDGPGPVLMPVMPVPGRAFPATYSTPLPVPYSDQSQDFGRSVNHRRDLAMSENFYYPT